MEKDLEGLGASLRQVVCETLENLAFTEVETREDLTLRRMESDYLGARISLGPIGTLRVILAKDLLQEIAEVLYSPGLDEMDAACLPDTLSEILNIIGGRFLEVIHQGRADFRMGLPIPEPDLRTWRSLPIRQMLVADGTKEMGVGLAPDSAKA